MSQSQTDATERCLDSLEELAKAHAKKAAAEARDLSRPLLLNERLYAAIGPALLAAFGLLFSWLSGWFDVSKRALEAQTAQLKSEALLLESQKNVLESEKNTLTSDLKLLEAQSTLVEAKRIGLQSETDRLQHDKAMLDREVKDLDARRSALDMTARDLKLEVEGLRLERDSAKQNERTAYLRVHLKELQDESFRRGSPQYSPSLERIREILINPQSELREDCMRMVLTRIAEKPPRDEAASLYGVLFSATSDEKWVMAILELVAESELDSGTYAALFTHQMDDSLYYKAVGMMVAQASRWSSTGKQYLCSIIGDAVSHGDPLSRMPTLDAYLDCIVFLRNISLDATADRYLRRDALRGLLVFAPSAWWVVYSELYIRKEKDWAPPSLREVTGELWKAAADRGERVGAALVVPRGSDAQAWRAWRQGSATKSQLELWLEPQLKTLRADSFQVKQLSSLGTIPPEEPHKK